MPSKYMYILGFSVKHKGARYTADIPEIKNVVLNYGCGLYAGKYGILQKIDSISWKFK